MSTALRNLAAAALLTTNMSAFAGAAKAAEITEAPPPARYAIHRHHYSWRVHSQLIEGVRGGTPLTVPFFGRGWYPGPAYYFGPPPGPCCRAAAEAVISVKY
jgi:hypothetical protein